MAQVIDGEAVDLRNGTALIGSRAVVPPPDPAPSYALVVPPDEPNWWLRLNDATAATVVDSSGNGRNATVNGAPTFQVPGLVNDGTAMLFSGADYLGLAATAADNVAARTYEAWIDTTFGVSDTRIISRNTSSGEKLEDISVADGFIEVRHWTSTGSQDTYIVPQSVIDGERHHVVVTFDGIAPGVVRIWIDGVLLLTDDYLDSSASFPAFQIGAARAANKFVGVLDEAAYYDHVLPDASIAGHWASRSA